MPRGSMTARETDVAGQRLDHWLWCARFFKTRTLAAEQIGMGRLEVNGQEAKAAKLLRPGDEIAIKRPGDPVRQVVTVVGLAGTRGPAPQAQALYAETAASVEARARAAETRRLSPEVDRQGRPTKRDRRELGDQADRWQRWSASIDDDA